MDAAAGEGDESVMNPSERSGDAQRLWETAQALDRAAAAVSPPRRALPPLLFFTDPDRTPRPWETAARLPAGSAVVYRAFGRADAAQTGLRLRQATRAAGVRLLVGLDRALAEAVEADGLHLPERALADAFAVRERRPDWLITGAMHDPAGAETAPNELDAVILSPVFPAGGASGARAALGVEALRTAAACGRPVYALGGVDATTAPALIGSGACGLAGIDGVSAAFDPRI